MTASTIGSNDAPDTDIGAILAIGEVASPQPRKGRRSWGLYLSVTWLGLILFTAIFANLLPLADPNTNITATTTPPFHTWPEFLGTDQLGRSVISRLIYGARVSLTVSIVAGVMGITIGVLLGLAAAASRRADGVVGVVTDATLAFPGIVLLLALGAVMTPGYAPLIIGLTVFSIPSFTRLAG